MPDTKGPGKEGSTQGQIKTPMSSENVDNGGDAPVHSYKKATGNISKSGGASIEGPGAEGNWDTQITIKGSNKGKY
jgi:hypothetical protein